MGISRSGHALSADSQHYPDLEPECELQFPVLHDATYRVEIAVSAPKPAAVLNAGSVWERAAVEAWAKRVGCTVYEG